MTLLNERCVSHCHQMRTIFLIFTSHEEKTNFNSLVVRRKKRSISLFFWKKKDPILERWHCVHFRSSFNLTLKCFLVFFFCFWVLTQNGNAVKKQEEETPAPLFVISPSAKSSQFNNLSSLCTIHFTFFLSFFLFVWNWKEKHHHRRGSGIPIFAQCRQ